eukprot:GHVS01019319.1.p1 GENE.GHVS01019319.1~~GHVS01019319.1.p1  ORF type:complete len:311 (+),score=64.48 GHVS01019319.1:216-1148(+)
MFVSASCCCCCCGAMMGMARTFSSKIITTTAQQQQRRHQFISQIASNTSFSSYHSILSIRHFVTTITSTNNKVKQSLTAPGGHSLVVPPTNRSSSSRSTSSPSTSPSSPSSSSSSYFMDRIIRSQYRQHLPTTTISSSDGRTPTFARISDWLFCFAPICAGAIAAHVLPAFGLLQLSRDVISWTIFYSAGVLAYISGAQFGLAMSAFAIMQRDHRGIWNTARHVAPLFPLAAAVVITALGRVCPHEAVYALVAGFVVIQLIDIFSHIYSLSPRWLARHRLVLVASIIASLAVLVTSEAQVYVGRKLTFKT